MSIGISSGMLRSLPLGLALLGVAQAGEPRTVPG